MTPTNNNTKKRTLTRGFITTHFKSKIRNTMGATVPLDNVVFCESISKGFVQAIPNRTQNDSVFFSKNTNAISGMFMSLAAGMCAAIFEVM